MEQQFDRQEMSRLVKQAMGEKTPFEYCRLTKLNSEYIDRLMTMQVKKPPAIGIIQQIAASSQGLVTLKELKWQPDMNRTRQSFVRKSEKGYQSRKRQRKISGLKLVAVSRRCRKQQRKRRSGRSIWIASLTETRKT